ncbi:AMP-binding protein [Algibacter sp. L1A34]|uniref:AMP-binding protein n=1 Tax=Algibacter sp. L1A34 TaxID=2686365 RepID=UPI00131C7C29|nr:AMP-binding protein [Algibacter sp. L1A34]
MQKHRKELKPIVFNDHILKPFINQINKDLNAFCINETFFTYKDFTKSISKIRDCLQLQKVVSKNVGLVVNDDLETYASIFAIWLEGLAYVPLHPLQPIERNIEIIDQAEVSLILDSSLVSKYEKFEKIATNELVFNKFNLEIKEIADSELAYILFTSGSTGKPKGVSITRGNVGTFIKSFFEIGFDITEKDRCLQVFDLTFDVSVQSYLVPLTRGACTFTIPHDQIKFSYVFGLLEDHEITFGAMAPSMLRYLRPYFDEINIPSMRYNILTAEASPIELVDEWKTCLPNARLFNFYGPTEATIYCTYYEILRDSKNKSLNGMFSIGKAMEGLEAVILIDGDITKAPGIKGELCVAGDQVTPGYWKNDSKNKDSFITKIINNKELRFYRTGDSCNFDNDGDILLYGRIDYQVKIQGYRIELGEIEYKVRDYLNGVNAISIAFTNNTGNTELALFVESKEVSGDDIKNYLSTQLPPYMLPSKLYFLNEFPLNTSGKINRLELKSLIK